MSYTLWKNILHIATPVHWTSWYTCVPIHTLHVPIQLYIHCTYPYSHTYTYTGHAHAYIHSTHTMSYHCWFACYEPGRFVHFSLSFDHGVIFLRSCIPPVFWGCLLLSLSGIYPLEFPSSLDDARVDAAWGRGRDFKEWNSSHPRLVPASWHMLKLIVSAETNQGNTVHSNLVCWHGCPTDVGCVCWWFHEGSLHACMHTY